MKLIFLSKYSSYDSIICFKNVWTGFELQFHHRYFGLISFYIYIYIYAQEYYFYTIHLILSMSLCQVCDEWIDVD